MEKIKGKTTKKTEEILWELRNEDTPRMITLVLREDTVNGLRKLQARKGHSFRDMDSLLLKMTEEVSKLWDPTVVKRKSKITEGKGRYIPVQVKAHVWKRDQGKCKNCGSDFALDIDHVKPYAIGGKTKIENLRLLCRNCNQRKGLEFFKKTFAC